MIYRITKTDGTVVMVDNPHNYPDPAVIELAEEPYAKVSIVSPPDYVGNIMPMCQERRGEFKDMQYLDTNLVEIHYHMPLNEIIYDFFDALKARTKGYASLDYELEAMSPANWSRWTCCSMETRWTPSASIAHRDKAYARARRICEKLKENIPRQLFEVPVQAAIGGKIIARETVKAMRKDVLAKCYGGDITRKKKLLEKQKEGKKENAYPGYCATAHRSLYGSSQAGRRVTAFLLPSTPHGGAAHCDVQAFCQRQNLGAGRIHFARAFGSTLGPPANLFAGEQARRKCVPWAPSSCPPKPSWPFLSWSEPPQAAPNGSPAQRVPFGEEKQGSSRGMPAPGVPRYGGLCFDDMGFRPISFSK